MSPVLMQQEMFGLPSGDERFFEEPVSLLMEKFFSPFSMMNKRIINVVLEPSLDPFIHVEREVFSQAVCRIPCHFALSRPSPSGASLRSAALTGRSSMVRNGCAPE